MNEEFLDAVKESVQISQQKWVKWQHEMMGIIHCGSCLALHDCWFVFGNEPIAPLHEKCHCTTVAIPTSQVKSRAKATSDYSKYDPYLFDPKNFYRHGKTRLLKAGDTLLQIRNGYKKKLRNRDFSSIFWEIMS